MIKSKTKKVFFHLASFTLLSFLPLLTSARFENPLRSEISDIKSFVLFVVDGAITILMPFVVLALIYSGFLFLFARGNEKTLERAKINFVWTVVGIAVLLGAKLLVSILEETVSSITG